MLNKNKIQFKIKLNNKKYKRKNITIDECYKNCFCTFRVCSAKCLGVIFNENLKWKSHINMVIIRLRKLYYIFKELRDILDISSLKTVYFPLVRSILMYGILVWGSAYSNVLEPLNITHRTLVRVIIKRFYNLKANTNILFQKLNMLTSKQLYNNTSIKKIHV